MIAFSNYKSSPLGEITVAAEGQNLIGLWLEGEKYFPSSLVANAVRNDVHPTLLKAKNWLDRYFDGERPQISEIELAPSGSEFRQTVWQALCEIPYGETVSYGDLAKKIARLKGIEKMSARAIGNAVGHNPISIIIPCHRVIGADGSLTGYAGGIDRKIILLRHEGVDI